MICVACTASFAARHFTPVRARTSYRIYDGKNVTYVENEQNLETIKKELAAHGFTVGRTRGDYKEN